MSMLYNPLPGIRTSVPSDVGAFGNALQNWGDHAAGLVGFFGSAVLQRLAKLVMSGINYVLSMVNITIPPAFQEILSSGLTVLGGFWLSRYIDDEKAAAVFQFGVVAGSFLPLLSGGMEKLKTMVPGLSGGWDRPGRVRALPALGGGGRFAATTTPAGLRTVDRNAAADYTGTAGPGVPNAFSNLQGDNTMYAPGGTRR